MESVTTQLKSHEAKTIQKKDGSGEYTLHIFTDVNGAQFQTIKSELANQGFPLTKEGAGLARVVFDVSERGKWKNNEIQFIEDAPAGASQDDTSKFKYAGGAGGRRGGYGKSPSEQRMINRSASAARAIEAAAAGVFTFEDKDGFERLVDYFVSVIERDSPLNLNKTGSQSQGDGGSSSAGGGADSGAAATAAAPSAGPSESIPY